MQLSDKQIIGFIIISEIFDAIKLERNLYSSELVLSESEELELNYEFIEYCMESVAMNFVFEKEFILSVIASSINIGDYDSEFEDKFYKILEEGGFLKALDEYDADDFEKRTKFIKEKYDKVFFHIDETKKINEPVELIDYEEDNVNIKKESSENKRVQHEISHNEDGIERLYYENGNIRQEIPYDEDGKIHGIARYYGENGVIYREVSYAVGNLFGSIKLYDEEGRIELETPYNDNRISGVEIGYYKSGNKEHETLYDCDDIILENKYYDNGNIKLTCEHERGVRNGCLKEYYEDGSLFKESKFEKNEIICDSIKEYAQDSSLQSKVIYLRLNFSYTN